MTRLCAGVLLLGLASPWALAKDSPVVSVSWPDSGQAVMRFTFSKFKDVGDGLGKEHTFITDTTAQNVSEKTIGNLTFSVYVFDKSKARIGDGLITLTNVAPGETVKFQVSLRASGTPISVTVATLGRPSASISVTVNSIPQGALLKVDGKEVGTTPKVVEVSIGKHMLEFTKDGFNPGNFPLEMTPHDASGGSVSYELGNAVHDTIEFRDGSVLSGDLISITGMQIELRIAGNTQTFDRNQVKRILLTERDPVSK
jgi:hypothetical protein